MPRRNYLSSNGRRATLEFPQGYQAPNQITIFQGIFYLDDTPQQEKVTWPDNDWPTPEQWLEWFDSLSETRRLQAAETAVASMQVHSECVENAHVLRLAEQRQALLDVRRQLADIQDELVSPMIDHASDASHQSQSDPESLPGGDGNRSSGDASALATQVLKDWGHGE